MAQDTFSQFPNWDDPAYRRYWLKHNLNSELWSDYSGQDIFRALASADRPVSENMMYEVRSYMLAHDDRVQAFNALNSDETIPIGMHEREPYWSMTSNYMYTVELTVQDEEGRESIITRAIGSNEQLTPEQLLNTADYYFGVKGNSEPLSFTKVVISHAYRR